jgi:O-antigen ligase
MPPKLQNLIPFTTSPLELFTMVAAAAAFLTRPSQVKLPLIAWAVPTVLLLGFAYGYYKGGEMNLAYNEARGLIVGVALFVLVTRVLPEDRTRLIKPIMVAETVLALCVVLRYVIYVRGNRLTVPTEFAFTHEGSVILGVGFIIGVVAFFRADGSKVQRVLSAAYCLLVLAAMIASGRRAATLVLLMGCGTLGLLMIPRRPMLVAVVSLPLVLGLGGYLGVYWNKEYGAMAQPARAIRSQFDPSLRDESSDSYRTTEKYNVIQTIRVNRVFGVGFGRQFSQFQPLPSLRSFWSLQLYTPHQNVLWIWLKMGIAGMAVILGFATVAIGRCFRAAREASSEGEWGLAAVALTVILMFLMYSTVDLGFIGPRSVAPAVVACAIAFSFARERDERPSGSGERTPSGRSTP